MKRFFRKIRQSFKNTASLGENFADIKSDLVHLRFAMSLDNLERISQDSRNLISRISKDRFVIFDYSSHHKFGFCNLGDDIQTIATRNALEKLAQQHKYEYFDKDNLAYYNSRFAGGGREKI